MKLRKRITAVVLAVAMLVVTMLVVIAQKGVLEGEELQGALKNPEETLHIWYADPALTDYINSAAISYGEENNIRVIPGLQTGLEYLEGINKASLSTEETPDLFVVSNDSLGKAYLAGLAGEIQDTEKTCTLENYPEPAMQAVTYHDKLVGYPFYYETAVLLYNKTYLTDLAKNTIEAEADAKAAEESEAIADRVEGTEKAEEILNAEIQTAGEEITEKEIEDKKEEIIPKTIEDILNFANEYDAPEAVEAVFKWDVSDIFYNYFFVGNYMTVGGPKGDNLENIDIYNQNTIDCLRVYQNLNQFFSIDTKEVTYDSVLQEFMDGKIVYSVVTTDAIAKIEEAKKEGLFQYEYGIATLPDLNGQLKTRGLSVTNAVVVNGYSKKKELANAFAAYLTNTKINDLYGQAGKMASRLNVPYENEKAGMVMEEYKKSIPMPKMLETSNFWVQLEICFTKVWVGEDVNAQLKQLSEQIMTQITGQPFEEEQIVEPTVEPETEVEYIDTEEDNAVTS